MIAVYIVIYTLSPSRKINKNKL